MNLSKSEANRYSRHLMLNEIGLEGQARLKNARVLVVGAGGLGCPALLYLAAAGIGTIGIMDFDVVDESNLQRQILFTVEDIGKSKAKCAASRLQERNPLLIYEVFNERLTNHNVLRIFENYDVIVDGTDDFATRYLINDACVLLEKPFVYGALSQFAGQVSVFNQLLEDGSRCATYRCLFPKPPAAGSVVDCATAGVFNILPGLTGTIQAGEVIKIILGMTGTLAGRILMIDGASMQFSELLLSRNDESGINIPASAKALQETDYHYFCNGTSSEKIIEPAELESLISTDPAVVILDVREEWEMPEFDHHNTIRIPLNELPERIKEFEGKESIVIVCQNGHRSVLAFNIINKIHPGFKLSGLRGGVSAWVAYSGHLS